MESRAISIVLGIALATGLTGCSSTDRAGSRGGGMDGGGQIGVGLAWDKGVFLQPLWQDGKLSMNVVNRRAAAVSLEVAPFVCTESDTGLADACDVVVTPTLVTWQVPAASTAAFDGAPLLVEDRLLSVRVGDEDLGLMETPRAPLGSEPGAFVSNQGFGTSSPVELTTSFASVPADTFTALLTLTRSGRLFVAPEAPPEPNVILLSPRTAHAQEPPTDASGDSFYVDVPPGTSDENPFQLQLEFTLPSDAPADAVFVLQPGYLCTEFTNITSPTLESCASTSGTLRLLLPTP